MTYRFARALLLVLVLLVPGLAWADDTHISASLDRSTISQQEVATLEVTVSGSGTVSEPQLPALPQFTIQSSEQSQNMTIVNGQTSSSMTFQYVLQPNAVGSFTIGPITVQANGRTLASDPLHLQVTRGAGNQAAPPTGAAPAGPGDASSARGPAFATAEVDNRTPYVGQAITYTLRFYHQPGVVLSDNAQLPETTGFVARQLPPETSYNTRINGRAYQVDEVQMALFPTSAGPHEVGPARLQYRAPLTMPDAWDPNLGSLLGAVDDQELATDSIAVLVRPTPTKGCPPDFTGGVGKFTLAARLDDAGKAQVGQPLNLVVTVQGTGNVQLVQAPPLPPLTGFKVYDVVASSKTAVVNHQVTGTRQFSVPLVPTQAGLLHLPAISMSTLDPATGRYLQVSTTPLQIAVGPAAPGSEAVRPAAPVPAPAPTDDGLRPLHLASALSTPVDRAASPAFLALQAVPLAVLGTAWWLWGRRPRSVRPGTPLQRARAQLRQGPPLEALPPVLYDYLEDRLGRPTHGMSTRELADTLHARGASATDVQRLEHLLLEAERARYAPAHTAPTPEERTLSADAESLLLELERSLK